MKRPENIDIWDGVELTRDDTLSEKEKNDLILQTLEKARASVNAQQDGAFRHSVNDGHMN